MTRRLIAGAALACAVLFAVLVPLAAALAQGAPVATPTQATTVTIPYGDWIVGVSNLAVQVMLPVLLTAATGLVAMLPWPVRLFLTSTLVERLARNALDYALNEVAEAAKGKALTVDVGRAVLARAISRAVSQAPGWLLDAAGGETGIGEKLFRLLHLDEKATVRNVLNPVLDDRAVLAVRNG